jgi:hypothetical protein
MAQEDRSFAHGQAETNRSRQQGAGVGQNELDLQQDPTEGGNPEADWGEALEGATHGENHTRRPVKTEAERGQGVKTRKANRDIASRRL